MRASETEIAAENKPDQNTQRSGGATRWAWAPGTGSGVAGCSCGGDPQGFGATRHKCVSASNPAGKLPSPTESQHPVLASPAKTQPALGGTLQRWH